jgi:hypothetical protein
MIAISEGVSKRSLGLAKKDYWRPLISSLSQFSFDFMIDREQSGFKIKK